MGLSDIAVIFFDLGDTLGSAELSAPPSHLKAFHVFPFVPSVLNRCRERGLRLGIISNTGDERSPAVDAVLSSAQVLDFFEEGLRIYSGDVDLRKDNPAIFRLAATRAGLGAQPDHCLFVGEDSHERAVAIDAGLRVCPHPLLIAEVLDGQKTRFVRITAPVAAARSNWVSALDRIPVVPLGLAESRNHQIYAITSERTRLELSDLGFRVDTLGESDLPLTHELFILRDDMAKESGFLSPIGNSRKFFSPAANTDLLLATDDGDLLIALPANRSLSEFHFEHARHGHTLKLTANPLLLQQAAPATEFVGFAGKGAQFKTNVLTAEELAELSKLDEAAIMPRVDRYSGKQPLSGGAPLAIVSRHISHEHNELAVQQLAKDFEAIGQGHLVVSLHRFTHLGKGLYNVVAELAGTSAEVVLVTAHLDSTAASTPGYEAATDSAPGADDDGSGIAAVLAIAERLVSLGIQRPPRRSIRFVLFNAEEEGLVGSQAYARLQKSIGASIVGVFQMDMIGYNKVPPRAWEVHAGFAAEPSVERRSIALTTILNSLQQQVAPSLSEPQIYSSATPAVGDPASGRSDHGPFQAQGYPACVSSEDFFVGPEPDSPEPEENPNYHTKDDTFVDGLFAADIARVIGSAAWVVSQAQGQIPGIGFTNFNQELHVTNQREMDSRKVGNNLSGSIARDSQATSMRAFGFEPGANISGATTRVNALTSSPASISSSGDVSDGKGFVERALNFLTRRGSAFGLASGQTPEFAADPVVQRTTAGGASVHLKQQYRGIPVFQMTRTVRFDPAGAIIDSPGDNAPIDPGVSTLPVLDVKKAVAAAAQHLATTGGTEEKDEFGQVSLTPTIVLGDFQPTITSEFSLPPKPTVLEKGPFENPIPASLVVFQQPTATRLGWETILTFPNYTEQFQVIVSADREDGEILYSRSLLHRALARGTVFEYSPGVADRRAIDFPRPITDYPAMPSTPLVNFPTSWVDVDKCQGNSTVATLGATVQTLAGTFHGGAIEFVPVDPAGDDQKILNIFYFCNYMHDFLYILGFDEAAGNFQQVNFTHTGVPGDPVRARAHAGTVIGTANMATRHDGLPPVMNMGLVSGVNRHTAFDADVVFHEYTHGLTNRLVGGPLDDDSLSKLQSMGMGEGWSDFFALTIQNFFKTVEKVVTGDWVVKNPAGIRRAPYDNNYPFNYGDLGLSDDEHDRGEVWCAALLMMVRRMRLALGSDADGYRLGWQMVVDGLKLIPANPTFLEARDGILMALDHLKTSARISTAVHKLVRRAAWEAFAHFGMGFNAVSGDADEVTGIVADKTVPPDL